MMDQERGDDVAAKSEALARASADHVSDAAGSAGNAPVEAVAMLYRKSCSAIEEDRARAEKIPTVLSCLAQSHHDRGGTVAGMPKGADGDVQLRRPSSSSHWYDERTGQRTLA